MSQTDDLKAFLAVAETGSVTRAAERLGLTQSGVSRKLAGLETSLGFRLFDRDRGRITINQQGRALAPHARRIVDTSSNLPRIARAIGAGHYDHVRIAATSSIMHGLLPPALARYLDERPGLPPSATMRSLAEILNLDAADAFDLVLAPLPMRPLAFEVVAEYTLELVLAVPRTLLPADAKPVDGVWPDFARLVDLPFISLDPFASYQESIEAMLALQGLEVRHVVETTSAVAAALMARSGVGCAFFDPFIAQAFSGPELIVARTSPPVSHAYGAHVPRGAQITPEAARLLRSIQSEIVAVHND